MSEDEITQLSKNLFVENQLTEAEVRLAARKSFDFLTACVDGQIEDARVGDRVMAAKTLLEHSAKIPGLLGEIADLVGMASDDDVAAIVTVLG